MYQEVSWTAWVPNIIYYRVLIAPVAINIGRKFFFTIFSYESSWSRHFEDVGSNFEANLCHFTGQKLILFQSVCWFESFNLSLISSNQSLIQFYYLNHPKKKSISVVMMCASPGTIREIMLAADDLNMIDSGEYVFFNIDLYSG